MTEILIIDDDERLAEVLAEYFQRFDFRLSGANRPGKGLELVSANRYDLVILDVMLPEMDGFDTCREIRRHSDIPIIMLTARGEVADRIVGLELGADDYLPKPFEPRELVARIQTILKRRKTGQEHNRLSFGVLVVDRDRRDAFVDDAALQLSSAEFGLLELLACSAGKTFSRDEILNRLRGVDTELFSRSVDILVSRLRKKMPDPLLIKTVRGSGYVFTGRPQ
ncbi:MAG: response regulator transcription factor [Gammaproteobacteria bacterium]|nr:response regulator transcription factor [Gammaproteobacteria bacterium]